MLVKGQIMEEISSGHLTSLVISGVLWQAGYVANYNPSAKIWMHREHEKMTNKTIGAKQHNAISEHTLGSMPPDLLAIACWLFAQQSLCISLIRLSNAN